MLRVIDAKRLNAWIHKDIHVVWMELDSDSGVRETDVVQDKNNTLTPLHDVLVSHRSTISQTLIPPKCTTE